MSQTTGEPPPVDPRYAEAVRRSPAGPSVSWHAYFGPPIPIWRTT
jgi:hypothetical protein